MPQPPNDNHELQLEECHHDGCSDERCCGPLVTHRARCSCGWVGYMPYSDELDAETEHEEHVREASV